MKKILVLGGSGFLGSYLCNKLILNKKFQVTNYDIKKNKHLNKKVKFVKASIENYSKLDNSISKSDIVYHFAGISDIEVAASKPVDVIKKNVLVSTFILELCTKYNIKKLIYASSIYVHSSSGSFYRISKNSVEDLIQEFHLKYNLNYLILRFGSIYGIGAPKTNGINKILSNLKFNKKLVYSGNKKAIREYINVDDAAKLSIKLLGKKYLNNIYNITGKKRIVISVLLKNLKKLYGLKKKPVFLNIKDRNHYTHTPYTMKPKKHFTFKEKNEKNFYNELLKLYKYL